MEKAGQDCVELNTQSTEGAAAATHGFALGTLVVRIGLLASPCETVSADRITWRAPLFDALHRLSHVTNALARPTGCRHDMRGGGSWRDTPKGVGVPTAG